MERLWIAAALMVFAGIGGGRAQDYPTRGQPAVMGQLIAGLLLGPSLFGLLLPDLQHALFPKSPEQKAKHQRQQDHGTSASFFG